MKINKWLAFASGAMLLCSCADDFDTNTYAVQRPGDAAQYDYLLAYAPLKEYIDANANPNLKIGAYINADTYAEKKNLYALANINFNEFSLANTISQSANASADGIDVSAASSFAAAAQAAGIPVFGGSLLGVDSQNSGWFSGLVNGTTSTGIREVKSEGIQGWLVSGPVDVTLIAREAGAADVADTFVDVDGKKAIKITSNANPTNAWDTQFFIGTPGKQWKGGESYHISFWYKASANAETETQCHGASAGSYMHWAMLPSNPSCTTEWQFYDKDGTIPDAGDGMQYIAFNLAKQNDPVTFYFADVVWEGDQMLTERTIDVMNGKMEEGKPMTSFVVREYGKGDKNGEIIVGGGPDGKNCIVVHAADLVEQAWDTQFFITYANGSNTAEDAEFTFAGGQEVHVSMWVKAAHAANADTQCHSGCGGYKHWACLSNWSGFTTEWTKYDQTFAIPDAGDGMNTIAFNLNTDATANDYYFADIHWEVVQKATAGSTYFYDEQTIKNGDMTGSDLSAFVQNTTWGPLELCEGEGPDGGNCVKFESKAGCTNNWESQIFIVSDRSWAAGDEYVIEMDVKASAATSAGTQSQLGAGGYIYWDFMGAIPFTTEWTHVKVEGKVSQSHVGDKSEMNTIAICVGGAESVTYELANVSWIYSEQLEGPSRSLTQAEKVSAVDKAFTSWINGAIGNTGSAIKEWNFLDQPLDESGAVRGLAFEYNDYLTEDYIVKGAALARAAYAEADTLDPKALKLYVNQSNLQKPAVLEGLKTLISGLAEKGVAIDGISADVTVDATADLSKQKEEIVAMFQGLNALNMPVRVAKVNVSGATDSFENLQKISDAYQMIVAAYVSNISADNQSAIVIGDLDKTLWFENYSSRQPAYAGVAEGLQGK